MKGSTNFERKYKFKIGTISFSIADIVITNAKREKILFHSKTFLSQGHFLPHLKRSSPSIPENNGFEFMNPPSLFDEVVSGETDPRR